MSVEPAFARYYGRRVCLDTMVWIYHFEERLPYLTLTRPLLQAIEHGYIQGVMSYLTLMEVLVKPVREGRQDLVIQYQHLLEAFPHLTLVPFGNEEALRAATMRGQFPALCPPDAMVLATALTQSAPVVITNDKRLRSVQSMLEIVVLDDLLEREVR